MIVFRSRLASAAFLASAARLVGAAFLTAACGTQANSGETGPGAGKPAETAEFTRPLPTARGTVMVWPDQLDQSLTDAQVRFAATHFVGTQKAIHRLSSRLRAISPDFLVLQYRLATGLSTVNNITGRDTWDRDTVEPTDTLVANDPRRTQETQYLHEPPECATRIAHADSYFLADIRNEAWQAAHTEEILRRMPTNDFDGVFLDTAHLRIDGFTPATWYVRFCGADISQLAGCWSGPARRYFEHLTRRLHAGARKYYAVGNFGPLITGWDSNDYLAPLDGGMVELFMWMGGPLEELDWHLSVARILRLIGNEKILIAEPMGYPLDAPAARSWILGNFLLLQGRHSYAAFYPSGTETTAAPVWLPEYEVDLGQPTAPLPSTPAGLCTAAPEERRCGGLYQRTYERGFVVVNPADAARTSTLPPSPEGKRWAALEFSGGGFVGADGRLPVMHTEAKTLADDKILVPPRSATVFQMISR